MFACVSADDDDSVTGYSRRDKRQVEQEDEIINKVLEEAMRLKKRCKFLTNALSDAENKAVTNKKDHEANLQREISIELSRITSTHEFDMAYLRDTKDREIHDLYRKLDSVSVELDNYGPLLQQITKSNDELKVELNVMRENYEKEFHKALNDHEAEKKVLLMKREDANDDQRSAMLRRAMIAENESQRLLQECLNLQLKIKDNQGQESIDTDTFAMDVKKIKALFEECKTEKDHLTVECEHLTDKLSKMTTEKETIAVALLALRNLQQFSTSAIHTCPSSPHSSFSGNQPHSLSDLKDSLNSLEAERIRLETKCNELEEALEEALEDTSELEETVRELIEGKNAVTDAVTAVQLENKTLKEEVEVLHGIVHGALQGARQDTTPNLRLIDKETEIKQIRKGNKNTADEEDEEKEEREEGNKLRIISSNKFFCSPPNTPVSFVSKAVSHKELLNSSKHVREEATNINPTMRYTSIEATPLYNRTNDVSLSPMTKSDTDAGKNGPKSHIMIHGAQNIASNDNVSPCTNDSMVNSSDNSTTSHIGKFSIISNTNDSNGASIVSDKNKFSSDINSSRNDKSKRLDTSHIGMAFNFADKPPGLNSSANSSRSASTMNSRSSTPSKNISTSHSSININLTDKNASSNDGGYNSSRSASPSNSQSKNIENWVENPLKSTTGPTPVRGPSPSRVGPHSASNILIPQDKISLPPSGKNMKLLSLTSSFAVKPISLETGSMGLHSRTDSAHTDNEDNVDDISNSNNSPNHDSVVTFNIGKGIETTHIHQHSTPQSASLHRSATPTRSSNRDRDRNAQTIASNYFLPQLPPPRSNSSFSNTTITTTNNNNTNTVDIPNPFSSNSLMTNIIATHPSSSRSRMPVRTFSTIPNFLSSFSPPKQSMEKSNVEGAIKPPSLTPRKKQQQRELLQQ